MGFTLAGRAEISESGCAGEDAFSGILDGGSETLDFAEHKWNWMRYVERGLRGVGRFRGAPFGAGRGIISTREFG